MSLKMGSPVKCMCEPYGEFCLLASLLENIKRGLLYTHHGKVSGSARQVKTQLSWGYIFIGFSDT